MRAGQPDEPTALLDRLEQLEQAVLETHAMAQEAILAGANLTQLLEAKILVDLAAKFAELERAIQDLAARPGPP